MNSKRGKVFGRIAMAVLAGTSVTAFAATPASAAESSAGQNGFDRTGTCDSIVGISDSTTSGKIEVFGGFSCPTSGGLLNTPTVTTIRVRLFRNGTEIIQSKKNSATCFAKSGANWTCSTDSHSVTYPDASSSDKFYGRLEIVSFSGNSTVTTGTITS